MAILDDFQRKVAKFSPFLQLTLDGSFLVGGNSNMLCFRTDPWGFMIQFDERADFFKWMGEKPRNSFLFWATFQKSKNFC